MHMGHVAMRVTSLERSVDFMRRTLGLRETRRDGGVAYLTSNEKHHELQLIAASEPGLDHVGLELESEDGLERTCERALAAGGRELPARDSEPGLGPCRRIEGPDDIVYELYAGMHRAPIAKDAYLGSPVRRFGHLTFHIAEPQDTVRFWTDGLGFRISDELEGIVWARCDVNHHGLAVAPLEGTPKLHHHAWEVQDVAALSHWCDGLAGQGLRLLWGPVRHGPGFNVATYVTDPDGGAVEVYTDLLKIYDDAGYVPIDWESDLAALDMWGAGPPPGMWEAGSPIAPPGAGTTATDRPEPEG